MKDYDDCVHWCLPGPILTSPQHEFWHNSELCMSSVMECCRDFCFCLNRLCNQNPLTNA